MRTIRSVVFYVMLFWYTVYCGLSAILVVFLTHRQDWAHLCGRLWANLNLWTAGVRVEVTGGEQIDPNHPYIYAANHQSWFDIFAILGRLPVQFRWLAKEELFKIPILGPAMSAIGYVPIDRTDRRKAFESLNQAALRVRNGASIVIFPEGTRSPDGVLHGFKKGGFILAIKSQQPMVPISISGSHRILPKNGEWRITPGTIRITLGNPIPTAGCTTKDRDHLMHALRVGIQEHLLETERGAQFGTAQEDGPVSLLSNKGNF